MIELTTLTIGTLLMAGALYFLLIKDGKRTLSKNINSKRQP